MKTIRKIISESLQTKLKERLIKMGPIAAKEVGIDTEDFINIVYDGEMLKYIMDFLFELVDLTFYGELEKNKKIIVMYEGTEKNSPLKGVVMEYYPKNDGHSGKSVAYIHKNKWDYISKYLTESQFINFAKDFWDLHIEKLNTETTYYSNIKKNNPR